VTTILLWLSGTRSIVTPSTWGLEFNKYHDHEAVTEFLHQAVQFFPNFASVYSIGASVYGKLS